MHEIDAYNLDMFKIVIILAAIAASSVIQSQECCPTGQKVIRRKRNPHYCLNLETNTTSFVPLTCNRTDIIEGDFNTFFLRGEKLIFSAPNAEFEHEPGTFCVGNRSSFKSKELNVRVAIVCYDDTIKYIDDIILKYCMILSSILLVLTAVIYLALPELRDLQGKSIINFCLSLGIGLAILAAMELIAYSDMDLCAARGFFAYFFIIASFFWMNAISLQILFSIRRPTISNFGWKEFIYYAVYAWGTSAVLTIAMAIVNFVPGDHFKPGIGLNHCWFFNKKQQWYYMYSVMTILITVNICIFLYITAQLWRQSFSSSHVKALRYKFLMTFRMSVIMGLAWIFEMVGSMAKSHVVWEILDLVNCLQGLLIFLVVVVFRRKVIKSLHKHGWLDWCSGPVERCLAVGEDEEDVVEHTIGITMT